MNNVQKNCTFFKGWLPLSSSTCILCLTHSSKPMVADQQCLLTCFFSLHRNKILQPCQDFLHATSRCRVVKVAAENHYLTLLGHLARILEVRILAADKRLKITFLCFKMQTYNERAKPLSLGCCDACFAIWNCITSRMQTRSSAVGSKLMVVGSTNGSSLNE